MTETRYTTSKSKKALNNQSFITGLEMTAIKSNSKHTKGISSSDEDNRKLFNLRQPNACGNNPKAVIGGTIMLPLLDTFMNAPLLSQGATILFLGLLIHALKNQ